MSQSSIEKKLLLECPPKALSGQFIELLYVLRMEQKRIPKKGLRRNPPGKRKRGRPKMTLRKTFDGDLKRMELTWGTAEREAKDRRSWRKRSSCIILNG